MHFRDQRLPRGGQLLSLYALHLQPLQVRDDFASFRGASDGLALRLRGSDASLHARLAPGDAVECMLFGLL